MICSLRLLRHTAKESRGDRYAYCCFRWWNWGHIYPALATVKQLKQLEPETEVLYIGGERGLEKSIVPEAGFDFKALAVQGFSRSLSLDNVKTVYLFLTATRKAKKMLEDFKPDVVVGTGGYVSGPVYMLHNNLRFQRLFTNKILLSA